MSTPFYHNHNSSRSYKEQWGDYLQDSSYVETITAQNLSNQRDTSRLITQQTKAMQSALKQANRSQVQAMQAATASVCGSIDLGMQHLARQMSDVNHRLAEVRTGITLHEKKKKGLI